MLGRFRRPAPPLPTGTWANRLTLCVYNGVDIWSGMAMPLNGATWGAHGVCSQAYNTRSLAGRHRGGFFLGGYARYPWSFLIWSRPAREFDSYVIAGTGYTPRVDRGSSSGWQTRRVFGPYSPSGRYEATFDCGFSLEGAGASGRLLFTSPDDGLGASIKGYVNGAEMTGTGTVNEGAMGTWYVPLGPDVGGQIFNKDGLSYGNYPMFAVWNRVLTPREAKELTKDPEVMFGPSRNRIAVPNAYQPAIVPAFKVAGLPRRRAPVGITGGPLSYGLEAVTRMGADILHAKPVASCPQSAGYAWPPHGWHKFSATQLFMYTPFMQHRAVTDRRPFTVVIWSAWQSAYNGFNWTSNDVSAHLTTESPWYVWNVRGTYNAATRQQAKFDLGSDYLTKQATAAFGFRDVSWIGADNCVCYRDGYPISPSSTVDATAERTTLVVSQDLRWFRSSLESQGHFYQIAIWSRVLSPREFIEVTRDRDGSILLAASRSQIAVPIAYPGSRLALRGWGA